MQYTIYVEQSHFDNNVSVVLAKHIVFTVIFMAMTAACTPSLISQIQSNANGLTIFGSGFATTLMDIAPTSGAIETLRYRASNWREKVDELASGSKFTLILSD